MSGYLAVYDCKQREWFALAQDVSDTGRQCQTTVCTLKGVHAAVWRTSGSARHTTACADASACNRCVEQYAGETGVLVRCSPFARSLRVGALIDIDRAMLFHDVGRAAPLLVIASFDRQQECAHLFRMLVIIAINVIASAD